MAGVCPLKVSSVYGLDPTSPELKSKVLLKLCMKFLTFIWNYSVCSQSS